jgi:uncharacterized protein (DUF302 family)
MLKVHSTIHLNEAGAALSLAARHHGASVVAVTDLSGMSRNERSLESGDTLVFTLRQPELYQALVDADVRFAALLPCRIAVVRDGSGTMLGSISPAEYCRSIHRADLESLTSQLETTLQLVMQEAARPQTYTAAAGAASRLGATEMQMNVRGTIPQRIDRRGSKVEDLGGTGHLDAPGG